MTNLYYSLSSGSVKVINDSLPLSSSLYREITLEITASAYETSGSTFNSTVGDLRVYIKSGSYIVTSFPIEETIIYYLDNSPTGSKETYTDTVTTLLSIPQSIPQPPLYPITAYSTLSPSQQYITLNYNFNLTPNITSSNSIFKIYTIQSSSIGDQYATGSTILASAFTAGTEARIYYSGNGITYRFIGMGNPIPENDIDGNIYFFSTGSTATITANNLTGSINNTLSGSSAIAGIDIIKASSVGGGGNFQLSGSSSGSYANFITFSTGSGTSFTTLITLGGGSDTYALQTSSILNISQSEAGGLLAIPNQNYYIELSGSGQYYTSSLFIYNNSLGYTSSFTSSNNYISTVFSSSDYNQYTINANTTTLSTIKLTYPTIKDIPVSPTESISGWINYLNAPINLISTSGSIITLAGENLDIITELNVTNSYISEFTSSLLNNLSVFNITTGSLNVFPNLINIPNIVDLDLTYNNISDSIPVSYLNNIHLQTFSCSFNNIIGNIETTINILPTSIKTIDVSHNNLTGSIPMLSHSINLQTFNCSHNKLSGSIGSLFNSYNLQYFYCNNNALTGSIPNLSDAISLHEFNCSHNKLSGSISNISSNYVLNYFDCSYNYLSGSINNLPQSLIQFIVNNNNLTGSINLSGSINLETFNAGYNKLSGSILSLEGCVSLSYFNCFENDLTGSIPSINDCTALTYFDVSGNSLIGSIPNLSYAQQLTYVAFDNNKLTSYTSASGIISPSLLEISAGNNLLNQSAVDGILYDLDVAGGINGEVYLNGTGNSAPSSIGLLYTSSLKSKGWYVGIN
jgi:Leucine-rich repeat (LRR) protein